jgi:formylglycine-generating enzyme required for sulfatase activity
MLEEKVQLTVVQLDLFQSSVSTAVLYEEGDEEAVNALLKKIRKFVKEAFNQTFENHEIHEYNKIYPLGGDGYRISFKDVDKAYTFVEKFRNSVDDYNQQQDRKKRLFRIAAATGKVLYDQSQLNIDNIIGHRVLFTVSRMVTAAEPGWLYVDQATYKKIPQDTQKNFILTNIQGKKHDSNLEAYACPMLKDAPQSIKSSYFKVATASANTTHGVTITPQTKSYQCIEIDNQPTQYFIEKLEDINLEMVYIPGGKFQMGTDDQEINELCEKYKVDYFQRESPQHKVIIEPFFMGKYPVTQAQWQVVAKMQKVNQPLNPDPSRFKGANRPVECVSWNDAVEFCKRLSNHTKREYRLPSEAEWEYACRAGTTRPFHFGETITIDLANYTREETTEVGSFKVANNFGLYDMHGNVWEWCQDHWHDSYKGAPTDGSAWQDTNKSNNKRMLRGGSCYDLPGYCRSAYRVSYNLDYYDDFIGFRVVCSGAART